MADKMSDVSFVRDVLDAEQARVGFGTKARRMPMDLGVTQEIAVTRCSESTKAGYVVRENCLSKRRLMTCRIICGARSVAF